MGRRLPKGRRRLPKGRRRLPKGRRRLPKGRRMVAAGPARAVRPGLRLRGPVRGGGHHVLTDQAAAGQRRRAGPGEHVHLPRRLHAGPGRAAEPGGRAAAGRAAVRARRRTRRRGARFLPRPGRLAEWAGAGELGGGLRRGHSGRFRHHPAVRQGGLPQPRTDDVPQGEGAVHRGQAQPRPVQGLDPGAVPQHGVLRPGRVRDPGRLAGILPQERRCADPRRGRPAGRADPGTLLPRPGARAHGGDPGTLALRDQRDDEHGRAAQRAVARVPEHRPGAHRADVHAASGATSSNASSPNCTTTASTTTRSTGVACA